MQGLRKGPVTHPESSMMVCMCETASTDSNEKFVGRSLMVKFSPLINLSASSPLKFAPTVVLQKETNRNKQKVPFWMWSCIRSKLCSYISRALVSSAFCGILNLNLRRYSHGEVAFKVNDRLDSKIALNKARISFFF